MPDLNPTLAQNLALERSNSDAGNTRNPRIDLEHESPRIGGWVAFFRWWLTAWIAMSVIILLGHLGTITGQLAVETESRFPGFRALGIAEAVVQFVLILNAIHVRKLLLRQPSIPKAIAERNLGKPPNSIQAAVIGHLVARLICALLMSLWAAAVIPKPFLDFLASYFPTLLMGLVWIPYFAFSKRIETTFCCVPARHGQELPNDADSAMQTVASELPTSPSFEDHLGHTFVASTVVSPPLYSELRATQLQATVPQIRIRPPANTPEMKAGSRAVPILTLTLLVVIGIAFVLEARKWGGPNTVVGQPTQHGYPIRTDTNTSDHLTQVEVAKVEQRVPEALFAESNPCVVRIESLGSRSAVLRTGSGFFVRDDCTVVTNYHVIEGSEAANVVLQDGTSLSVAGVEGFDETSDVAILKVARRSTGKPIRHLPLGPDALPPIGSKTYVIGSPLGLENSISDGLVSGIRKSNGRTWIQTTAAISPGSSGSPVFREDGAVIGVATLSEDEGQNVNFALAVQHVREVFSDGTKKTTRLAELNSRQPMTQRSEEAEAGRRAAMRDVANEAVARGQPPGVFGTTWLMSMSEVQKLVPTAEPDGEGSLNDYKYVYDRDAKVSYGFQKDMLLIVVVTFRRRANLEQYDEAQRRLTEDYGNLSKPVSKDRFTRYSTSQIERFNIKHILSSINGIPMEQVLFSRTK